MSLANKYRKSLDSQWCLRFKTMRTDEKYDGVVTNIKNDFVVLHEVSEFVFNGFNIIPKKYITGYRDSKFERCLNEILCQNGEIKKYTSPHWLDSCNTMSDILKQMMSHNIWPGIETLRNTEGAFYLGPITEVNDDHFYLWCYDAAGKWEDEYKLSYKEIFRIEFNSMYCNNFNAYMRKQRRHKV